MNIETIKKKFDFIPDHLYKKLDKRTRDKLLMFRKWNYNLVRKEQKISNLESKIKDEKEMVKEMRSDLINLHNQIQHLRKDFYFTCSVVSYKSKYNRYYNLLISRTGLPNKSVSLGSEEKIKDHLLKSYKGTKKISNIKKDWKNFLKVESNMGGVYDCILEMIMSNPSGFNEQKGGITITKDDLFPIKK
ncbi:bZIP transcription factor [Candidatus Woesearchaeota archaeon]|jgi:hypothetical protein|nr:bZIP transcription factor [Candidatus Woesearchaeota archaeon]